MKRTVQLWSSSYYNGEIRQGNNIIGSVTWWARQYYGNTNKHLRGRWGRGGRVRTKWSGRAHQRRRTRTSNISQITEVEEGEKSILGRRKLSARALRRARACHTGGASGHLLAGEVRASVLTESPKGQASSFQKDLICQAEKFSLHPGGNSGDRMLLNQGII